MTDTDDVALVRSMIGHCIIDAHFYDPNPESWWSGEIAILRLDDGRLIEFGSVGGDASSATVRLVMPDA